MSLFEALDTSKSGMYAQSKSTAIVSTNVANMTTVGYKRSEAIFHDLVTTSQYSPAYEPGGVRATRVLRADQQGSIQQTTSSTDASIIGNGFFVVGLTSNIEADSGSAPTNMFFTRNGTFGETVIRDFDAGTETTYLANSAGQYLYGWQFDELGDLPTIQDFSSLTAINISQFESVPLPTSEMSLSLNLAADAEDIDMHLSSLGVAQLPAGSEDANFTRSFTVYDQNGQPQELLFEYRKIVGPMAHFTTQNGTVQSLQDVFLPTSGNSLFNGINAGDSFSVDVGGVSETYTFVDEALGDDLATNQIATMQGLVAALKDHGADPLAVPPVTGMLEAGIENGRLLVRAVDPTATITLAETTGTPLTGGQTLNIINDPDAPGDLTFEPDEDITNPTVYGDQEDFPDFANTTNPVPQNWWELTIISQASGATVRQGLLNFNGDGTLNALPDANGNITLDLATTPVDFDGDPATADSPITIDITNTSQFAGNFDVINTTQNGAGIGDRTGIEITDDGRVVGIFSNGVRANLYQIPLANFANANGLNDESGTIFSITEESGDPILALSGTNGNGTLRGSTIESSNVDITDEFGHLIVSQRGFSLNSQVIQAIDEMAERLGQL